MERILGGSNKTNGTGSRLFWSSTDVQSHPQSVYLSTKRVQTEWPVYLDFVRRSQRQQTILDGDGAGAAEASSSCWLRLKRLTRTDRLHCRLWLTSV